MLEISKKSRNLFFKRASGQGMLEYMILLGIVLVAAIGGLGFYGSKTEEQVGRLTGELTQADGVNHASASPVEASSSVEASNSTGAPLDSSGADAANLSNRALAYRSEPIGVYNKSYAIGVSIGLNDYSSRGLSGNSVDANVSAASAHHNGSSSVVLTLNEQDELDRVSSDLSKTKRYKLSSWSTDKRFLWLLLLVFVVSYLVIRRLSKRKRRFNYKYSTSKHHSMR